MNKIYSLLRNNRQQGPYSLEELSHLKLKSFDLVWVDGKSAGWRYPSEIPELKSLLEPVPENPPPLKTVEQRAPDAKPAPANHSHIYVSLPGTTNTRSTEVRVQETTATIPSVKEITVTGDGEEVKESFEQRVERMRQRVAAVESGAPQANEEDSIHTKYTRSLDDIKQEYSSWLHSKKKKRTFHVSGKARVISGAAVVLIPVILIFSFSGSAPDRPLSVPPSTSLAALLPQKEKVTDETAPVQMDEVSRRVFQRLDLTLGNTKKQSTSSVKKKTAKKPVAAIKKIKTVSKPEAAVVKTAPVKAKPSVRKSTPDVARRIYVKGYLIPAKKGVGGMELLVRNNSTEILKTVAVDVAYHQKGQIIKKETIYFSNIAPGGTQTKSAPAHKKATAISYEMGLVSSSSGGLYVGR
jgi:hypothetical protein